MAHQGFSPTMRKSLICLGILLASMAGGAGASLLDACGPFTDVSPAQCPFVAELYFLGITAGTSPTTYSPDDSLTRGQAAVFAAKGLDQSLARGSRRAALNQWWSTSASPYGAGLALTHVPLNPADLLAADGEDIWVTSQDGKGNGAVTRVRASDGRFLDTWNVPAASAVLPVMGRILVGGFVSSIGYVYMIDPTQPSGPVSPVTSGVSAGIVGLTFDGARLWTANFGVGVGGSVSIVTPSADPVWPSTTVNAGIANPINILYDGTSVWVVDTGTEPGALLRLDSQGAVVQTVVVGSQPRYATFDGANIWVPNSANASVTVVRASTGTVLATLTGNGLDSPWAAGFDGQRVLVTNVSGGLSLFKAADLTPIRTVGVAGTGAYGVCSDGVNFWIGLPGLGAVGRF